MYESSARVQAEMKSVPIHHLKNPDDRRHDDKLVSRTCSCVFSASSVVACCVPCHSPPTTHRSRATAWFGADTIYLDPTKPGPSQTLVSAPTIAPNTPNRRGLRFFSLLLLLTRLLPSTYSNTSPVARSLCSIHFPCSFWRVEVVKEERTRGARGSTQPVSARSRHGLVQYHR